jgi:hypothetical protein
MSSGIKSPDNKIDWKTVDLYNKSLPEDINKRDVIHMTGTIKIEVWNIILRWL